MNIDLSVDRPLGVRSVEVVASGYRNRTSFGEIFQPEHVFLEPIAEAIKDCLSGVRQADGVVALPEFILELPGLLLRGVHVMVSKVTDKLSHVIVRFQQFLGSLASVLHHEVGFNDGLSDQTDDLAVKAFADIVTPLLNICELVRQGGIEGGCNTLAIPNRIHDLTHEVGFHAELLKRFVHQRGRKVNGQLDERRALSRSPDADEKTPLDLKIA